MAHGLMPTLVFTGPDSGRALAKFGLDDYPRIDLCCEEGPILHGHVRAVTRALLPQLRDTPDLLMVVGATSSALGAALAGFVARVPVAHLEASLRAHNPDQFQLDEEYRLAIDSDADLLFAPTETEANNLRLET